MLSDMVPIYDPDEFAPEGEGAKTIYVKVSDAVKMLWSENTKSHDFGSLIESIERYGFQVPPKFDKHLGIKAGNGRIEALWMMENKGIYDRPRGIMALEDGQWLMPLTIGVDALDKDEAMAYAIDDNNLTLSGGDFTITEMTRMHYEEGYVNLITYLAKLKKAPVSVGEDGVNMLIESLKQNKETEEEREERVSSGETECPNCGFVF